MEEGTSSGTSDGQHQRPPSMDDLVKYTQDVYKAVVSATRCAKALPKLGDNYELYNSYPIFAELMKAEGERALQLVSKLCKHAGAKTHLLDNTLLAEERTERLAEVNDFLLERVGNLLDEAAGLRRPEELVVVGPDSRAPLGRTINTRWNRALHQRQSDILGNDDQSTAPSSEEKQQDRGTAQQRPVRLLGSFNVPRPQVAFADQIDNSNKPFVPRLRYKHNANERTRSDNVRVVMDDGEMDHASAANSDMEAPSHPYKYELDHFAPEPWQLEYPTEITEAKPIEETPLVFIRTEDQLEELCRTLKTVREFAVDLEAHSYRSFQGLVCLVQISTRTHDYIVDPFPIWRNMHVLNDPFTDASIVKVFHGSNFDVVWLQRDFGIYVVNMFDTGQAMRLLNFPRFSLAHLVRHYCGEELEKEYQLSDWRIRPLPDELISYARKDTHYLLNCYDRLRRDLLDAGNEQKNLLRSVYSRSRDICLIEYHKRLYNPDDYFQLLEKSRKRFNSRQLYALKELYAWRDSTARIEDESTACVLPDHMLLQIAEVLPREMAGIWACCCPVPPLVRRDSHPLHRMIVHARALPLETSEAYANRLAKDRAQEFQESMVAPLLAESRSRILRSHDFSHSSVDEEIVPLSQRLRSVSKAVIVKEPSISFVFQNGDSSAAPSAKKRKMAKPSELELIRNELASITSPYERYLLALASNATAAEKEATETEMKNSGPKKQRMYSHLDPVVDKSKLGVTMEDVGEEPSTSGIEATAIDGQSTVPKKKRKVDATGDEGQSADLAPLKRIKRKKNKPEVVVESAYDYSTVDKSMFSKGSSNQGAAIFEPHKEFMNKRDKKNVKKMTAKKGATATLSGNWKKKSSAAFASFEPRGSGSGKTKKKGNW